MGRVTDELLQPEKALILIVKVSWTLDGCQKVLRPLLHGRTSRIPDQGAGRDALVEEATEPWFRARVLLLLAQGMKR